MRLNKKIYGLLALLVFAAACQKDVDNIPLPVTAPKLVVGCFISPQDTNITVTLTRSNPIFGPGHSNTGTQAVTDASVVISDGINSATIPYNSFYESYQLSASAFPITGGQTYNLTVSTPKGENVSATCSVPASYVNTITVDFIDTTSTNGQYKFTQKWQDLAGETNYYRVCAQIVAIDSFSPNDSMYYQMWSPTALFNDNEKDGQELYCKLQGWFDESSKPVAYEFFLLTLDPEYYKYQNSLEHYTYNDPFSEPSPIYTNVQGGLGIFAAYQKYQVRYH